MKETFIPKSNETYTSGRLGRFISKNVQENVNLNQLATTNILESMRSSSLTTISTNDFQHLDLEKQPDAAPRPENGNSPQNGPGF
jgi:hypothetical protein